MDSPELVAVIARTFAAADADHTLPMRLCEASVDIFQAQGGALTVSEKLGDRIAVSTPGEFEGIEPLQEVLGEGPVHQAMAKDRLVVVRIGAVLHEYPVFSHLAESVGDEVTLYAVPIRARGRCAGVLSLYMTAGSKIPSSEDLLFVADALGAVLLGNLDLLDWSEKAPLHRATGMVVAQLGVRPDDASAVIRAHAFSQSTSLLSVAQDVLDLRVTFSHDKGGPGGDPE